MNGVNVFVRLSIVAVAAAAIAVAHPVQATTMLFSGGTGTGELDTNDCPSVDPFGPMLITSAAVTLSTGSIDIDMEVDFPGPPSESISLNVSGDVNSSGIISNIQFNSTGTLTGSNSGNAQGETGSFSQSAGTLTLPDLVGAGSCMDDIRFEDILVSGLQKEEPPADPQGTAAEETQDTRLSHWTRGVGRTVATKGSDRVARRGEEGLTLNGIGPTAGGLMLEGRSAGDGAAYPWGVWASYQRSEFEDSFAATAFEADSDLAFVGADISPWDNFVFGVGFGYESTDVESTFNGGEMDAEGYSVVPYLGAVIGEQVGVDFDLAVDFVLGYSRIDVDQFRSAGGARVTSETDSERWFMSGNLTAARALGNWYVSGRAGWLYAQDEQDGFVESDGTVVADRAAELGRLTLGADVAYAWNAFEPYVNVIYEYDYSTDRIVVAGAKHPNDRNGLVLGGGLRWYSDLGFTATFQYDSVLWREDFDSQSYNLSLRWDF